MSATQATIAAPVLEVFASIQGEGLYVGAPQVFLRLRGCPLRCAWCDTPGSWGVPPNATARVQTEDGPRREEAWATPFQVACWVAAVEPGDPRPVSITGGEPLMWPDFLADLPKMLGDRPLHLETGGGHPETLARVLDVFAHVSLDLKLPADMLAPVELAGPFEDGIRCTSEPSPRDADEWGLARRRSLALVSGRDACAKIVISAGRTLADYQPLLEDVAHVAASLPVFLQPVTPTGDIAAPPAELLEQLVEDARDLGLDVRVVPQVHRQLRLP